MFAFITSIFYLYKTTTVFLFLLNDIPFSLKRFINKCINFTILDHHLFKHVFVIALFRWDFAFAKMQSEIDLLNLKSNSHLI